MAHTEEFSREMLFNGQSGDKNSLGDESLMTDTHLHSNRH